MVGAVRIRCDPHGTSHMLGLERDVDGVHVGGASLDPAEFATLVRFESHLVTD